MIKQFNLENKNLVLFIVTIFMISCGTKPGDDSKTPMGDSVKAEKPFVAASPQMRGTLDTLYIQDDVFEKAVVISKDTSRVVFQFFLKAGQNLTLHGWVNNDNIFKDDDDADVYTSPDIVLKNYHPTENTFGPGNYFGNLILRKNNVKEVLKKFTPGKKEYVLFAPLPTEDNGGHIIYQVFVTDSDLDTFNNSHITPPVVVSGAPVGKTNPSPPRKAPSETGGGSD